MDDLSQDRARQGGEEVQDGGKGRVDESMYSRRGQGFKVLTKCYSSY
jgi:hypothetical protein